jgi:hypothetical protein
MDFLRDSYVTDDQTIEQFRKLIPHLDEEGALLWQAYLQAESQGIRKVALTRLDAFSTWAKRSDASRLDAWIAAFCEALRASGQTSRSTETVLPVRFSLLREIVLPRLFEGYHLAQQEAVSHLVVLTNFFYYTAPQAFLEAHGMPPTKQIFLQEALRINPGDSLALENLIKELARRFDYVIHEVPFGGVLTDDARADLESLDDFQALVQRGGQEEHYSNFIATVRCYLTAWDRYLAEREPGATFAVFLLSRDLPLSWPST